MSDDRSQPITHSGQINPTPMRKTDQVSVFLSYARADDDPNYDDTSKSFMRRLYNALTKDGFAVWWDRESLPSRSLNFTQEIEQAIRACQRFVLVVGPGAIASDYVRAEWQFALRECKPITPILRDGDYNLVPADFGLNAINTIDVRPARDEHAAISDLIKRLNDDAPIGMLIGVKPLPDGYIKRQTAYDKALAALRADAIQTAVITSATIDPRAVALFGMGGIGKSTLAAALSHDCQVRRHFHDGVIWIEVGQKPDIAALQASIGVHFGDVRDNYRDEREGELSLSRLLKDKSALIILDDVWDHKLVARFPVDGTACRLLITTRNLQLAHLVQGEDVHINVLSAEEGARLIAARIGSDPNDLDARAIVELLGGHTLAIALAAAQIDQKYADSLADMRRLLEKRQNSDDPFRDLQIDPEDKDLNLSRSLALSYEALKQKGGDLQRRFRALGALAQRGTFSRAMLTAVWGDKDEDDARAPLRDMLGALLLEQADADGRYTIHRLIHAYARALLTENGEADATFARYAAHVTAIAAQFEQLPLEQWHKLDDDLPHIEAVGDELVRRWRATGEPDEKLVQQVAEFVWEVMLYVVNRPQAIHKEGKTVMRGLDWLAVGLSAYQKKRRPQWRSRDASCYRRCVFEHRSARRSLALSP